MWKLRATGRGRNFSAIRGLSESALSLAYRGGWPGRLYGRLPRATHVDVLGFELPILPRGAPSLRVAFASDLHLGPTTPARTLDRAFDALTDARPDVLLLGGDYVYLEATAAVTAELRARVAGVPARVKLAVLGNHDLWTDHGRIEGALRDAGARVLVNEAVRLTDAHADLAILGIDDPWTGAPDVDRALAHAGDAATLLAVCHAPEGLPLVTGRGLAALLCGHTHGGQVALPRGPVYVPGPLGPRYPHGRHDVDGTHLFVSRGVGTVEVALRTWAPPDIAVITLVARSGDARSRTSPPDHVTAR